MGGLFINSKTNWFIQLNFNTGVLRIKNLSKSDKDYIPQLTSKDKALQELHKTTKIEKF